LRDGRVAIVAAILAIAPVIVTTAFAPDAWAQTTCQTPGYRMDNFGYGLHSGYTAIEQRPSVRDDSCFALGFQEGLKLRIQFGSSPECRNAYQDGFSQGFAGDNLHLRSESTCSQAGYAYGIAFLRANAREQRADVVGSSCASAFQAGFTHGANRIAATPPSDRRDAFCYLSGHSWALSGQ